MKQKSSGVLKASAVIVIIFVFVGVAFPDTLGAASTVLLGLVTEKFGWSYLASVFAMVVFALFVALSPMGKLKLGKAEEKPEFGDFQWFTLLFGGAMGIGLVFYSVAEPLMHYAVPPTAQPGTEAAMYEAMESVFFHWGLHPWAIFAIGGLALGYFAFKKDRPFLVSSAFEPLIGSRARGPIGKAIDVLAVFATIFGVATSLGLGASQIVGGLSYIYGVKTGTLLTCLIIAGITLAFTIATMTGLQKGIQLIADIKVWLSVAFMVFIFVFGGAVFILDVFTSSLGGYLGSLVSRSLWMGNKRFVTDWTVFYWAWWIAWAPFCGQFCARVSRGRTVRQYILTVCLLPVAFSLIWLGIYGGAAFHSNALGGGALAEAVNNDYTSGLFALLRELPLYTLTAPLALVLIVFSFLGSANSATFVLSMLTDRGNMEPDKKLRAGWGVAQGGVTIICIIAGGTSVLEILQTVSILSAFPYMIVMLLMCVSIYKTLRKDAKDEGYIQ